MYRGWMDRCEGRHDGVSRINLCSRAQRPTGMGSSDNAVCRRSVTVPSAVEALGLDGMKYTLGWLVLVSGRVEVGMDYPVIGILGTLGFMPVEWI